MGDDSFAACHLHQVIKSDDDDVVDESSDDVVDDDEGGDGQLHQVHNSGPCQHRQFIFPSIWWTGNILILISVFSDSRRGNEISFKDFLMFRNTDEQELK